jgi:hypothetical protein
VNGRYQMLAFDNARFWKERAAQPACLTRLISNGGSSYIRPEDEETSDRLYNQMRENHAMRAKKPGGW